MAATWGKGLLSGVIFGSALTAAGVYEPAVIVGQMRLEDFHMLKTFIAASGSSALAIVLANRSSLSNVKPRSGNSVDLFGPYDGNILGGLLLGFGMTLTGACPGTVLPQVATSVPSGPLVLLGGVLGGILWSGFGRQLLSKARQGSSSTASDQARVSKTSGLLTYELLCLSVLGAATLYTSAIRPTLLPPIIGGLLIGLSQFSSLLLTTNTLGISTAYEQIGDYFWYLLSSTKLSAPSLKSNIFAAGTILGSWTVNRYADIPPSPVFHVGALRAIVGGVILTFGSRLAGGCTSGHGISGMSTLSISSFITVASMFVGGMGLAAILG